MPPIVNGNHRHPVNRIIPVLTPAKYFRPKILRRRPSPTATSLIPYIFLIREHYAVLGCQPSPNAIPYSASNEWEKGFPYQCRTTTIPKPFSSKRFIRFTLLYFV
jgi:hypothetical protein